jgi:hypothetical protein
MGNKRQELIEQLAQFYDSIPKEASSYHKMDVLMSNLVRHGIIDQLVFDLYYEEDSDE